MREDSSAEVRDGADALELEVAFLDSCQLGNVPRRISLTVLFLNFDSDSGCTAWRDTPELRHH